MYDKREVPEHRKKQWPRSGRNFFSENRHPQSIDEIGISLLTNRDFPPILSILFCTFVVEKERETKCLTL